MGTGAAAKVGAYLYDVSKDFITKSLEDINLFY